MKKVKYILVFLLGLFFTACSDRNEPNNPSGAKYKLSGSVVMNGEPVNAAAVLLTPGGGSCITGSDGIFNFEVIEGGSYEIKVYKEGCLPFNKSLTIDKTHQNIDLTVSENTGNLHLNKGYVDMGSYESNNVAAFVVTNTGNNILSWKATTGAQWITKIEPANGEIPAGGSAAVSFTINRDCLSQTTLDNHASILVSSTTDGDGSLGELLITAFGKGDGANMSNDNSDLDYVIIGDLYIQTTDLTESPVEYESANVLCNNSIKGGFSDWRLPEQGELATMYENRAAIGGFIQEDNNLNDDDLYWAYNSFYLKFSSGETTQNHSYTRKGRVRAVRKATPAYLPNVTIQRIAKQYGNTISFYGEILYNGQPKYTERGFVISDKPNPTIDNGAKYVSDAFDARYFYYDLELDGSQYGKNYYYVAYARNSVGYAYSPAYMVTYHHPLYYFIPDLKMMVQRIELGYVNYEEAIDMCKRSKVAGFSDWRLPTLDEAIMIYQYGNKYEDVRKNTQIWTSSIYRDGYRYTYNLYNGTKSHKDEVDDSSVLAVRIVNE